MKQDLIYLASQSPRRRELLTQINVPFEVLTVAVEEQHQSEESSVQYVERLACEKARAGVAVAKTGHPVLGSDTIVVLDGEILEKPKDKHDAVRMLRALSDNKHQVMTAIALADNSRCLVEHVTTEVSFRVLSDIEIEAYWDTGEPADKAGAYGIQGIAGKFVSNINGSYSAVVGLPLMETDRLIRRFMTDFSLRGGEV